MRSKVNLTINAALADRARNIVASTPGLTLTMLVERGLRLVVARCERENGGPAPVRRTRRLPAGRKAHAKP